MFMHSLMLQVREALRWALKDAGTRTLPLAYRGRVLAREPSEAGRRES